MFPRTSERITKTHILLAAEPLEFSGIRVKQLLLDKQVLYMAHARGGAALHKRSKDVSTQSSTAHPPSPVSSGS